MTLGLLRTFQGQTRPAAQINPEGNETSYEIEMLWQDADPPAPGEAVSGGSHATGRSPPASATGR
jgi:hypothetical protein